MIIGDMEIRLRADIARLQRDMDDARRVVGDATAAMGRAAEMAKAAFAGIAGAIGLAKIAEMSDEYSKLTAQLRMATDSTRAYNQAYADVKRIATTSQTDLAATGSLYASLSRATKDLGTSQKSVADITEAVNLSLKISGAGAQESSGAILQLSQAFAAGALRGDEFNSVTEAAPRLMKAIADNIGAPVGALRTMAEQGKLTADLVAKTLPQALDQLRAEAGQIQTISGAFTVLKNNVMEFVGTQAQTSGVVTVLTGAISLLANNLSLLADAAIIGSIVKLGASLGAWTTKTYEAVAAAVAARAATIASMEANVADTAAKAAQLTATHAMIGVAREEAIAKLASANASVAAAQTSIVAAEAAGAQSFALRTVRLATAELSVAEAQRSAMLAELAVLGRQQAAVSAQLTEALAAQAAAQAVLNGATGAGSIAAGVASRAVGLLGGPIGIVITLLGIAATAWTMWSHSAETGSQSAAESYEEAHKRIVKGLDEQIAKNEKLIKYQNMGLSKVEINRSQPVLDQLAVASKRLDDINNRTGDYASGKGKSNTDVVLDRISVLRDIVELTEKMKKDSELAAKAAAGDSEALLAVRQRLTGVNQQYLDDLQKLQVALDKGSISQTDYVAAVSKLAKTTFEGSETGKLYASSLDAQATAIQRAAEAQGLRNQREQEHIQFLQASGQASEADTINATAAAQIKGLNQQIATQQQLMGIEASRQQTAEQFAQKQAEASGRIAALRIQIDNAQAKRDEDLFQLEQQKYRQATANSADRIEAEQAELASLRQQTQAQVDQNEQIGLSQKQVAELTAKYLEMAAARKDAESVIAEGLDLTGERAQRIREEAAEIRKRSAAIVEGAAKQELYDKTIQDASTLVDIMSALDEAAQSAAQGMAKSFGSVGEAIGGMTTALTGYERTQAAIAARLANATKDAHGDTSKIARANQIAAEASAQAQVKSYGDMASAAKGFFNENSAGYKVLGGIEKAYRAAEMAMALESMAKKILFKETEVTANTTLNATKLAGEATASAASTGLAATEASAWGITAVVKAIASLPFPLNLAAGAATMAAVVAVGAKMFGSVGGSSVSVSQQRQASQGTGTVLGDSSAKSASIDNAIKLTAANSSTQINYLASMNAALQTIQANIKNFAAQLLQTTDVTNPNVGALSAGGLGSGLNTAAMAAGGYALGASVTLIGDLLGPVGMVVGALASKIPAISNLVGKISNGIFGGKQSVEDSGLTMDKTSLAAIMSGGLNAKTFADVKTDGGWFRGDKHDTKTTSVGAEANRQFATIITSMADAVKQAGVLLGMNGDAFSAKLNTFVVDIGKVSLKDLKGDDLQKALEAVFSKLGDQMASFGVAGLQQFQQVGEGYLETLVRVASDYAKVDASLQSIGKTFGAVGVESIAARENLISLLGGIDDFQSKTADYGKNFLTTAQQLAPVQKYVTDSLTQMGLGWVTTRQQFAGVVAGLDLTTTAGQQTYAALMNLEAAFAATHEAIVDTTKSAQDIADERKDLQSQLDQLTMTQAQLLAKQRDALDDSNKALFDQVQAAQKVKDAQDAAKTSLGNFLTQMKSFAATTAGLNNSLTLGSLSTLTPEQQYAEARRQFDETRQKAAAGDATAQGSLQSIEQTFLQLSQKLNAGDAQYSSDLAAVMHANDDLAKWASQQVDVAQASLDALNDSSATLTDISATLKAIAQGGQLPSAAIGAQVAPNSVPVSAPINYSVLGTDNTVSLVTEIKALRVSNEAMAAELKGLRADQQKQTGDVLKTVATSADNAADKVVAGKSQADTDIEWRLKAAVRKIV